MIASSQIVLASMVHLWAKLWIEKGPNIQTSFHKRLYAEFWMVIWIDKRTGQAKQREKASVQCGNTVDCMDWKGLQTTQNMEPKGQHFWCNKIHEKIQQKSMWSFFLIHIFHKLFENSPYGRVLKAKKVLEMPLVSSLCVLTWGAEAHLTGSRSWHVQFAMVGWVMKTA